MTSILSQLPNQKSSATDFPVATDKTRHHWTFIPQPSRYKKNYQETMSTHRQFLFLFFFFFLLPHWGEEKRKERDERRRGGKERELLVMKVAVTRGLLPSQTRTHIAHLRTHNLTHSRVQPDPVIEANKMCSLGAGDPIAGRGNWAETVSFCRCHTQEIVRLR